MGIKFRSKKDPRNSKIKMFAFGVKIKLIYIIMVLTLIRSLIDFEFELSSFSSLIVLSAVYTTAPYSSSPRSVTLVFSNKLRAFRNAVRPLLRSGAFASKLRRVTAPRIMLPVLSTVAMFDIADILKNNYIFVYFW